MQRILDHITDTPAIVMTPIHDVLAWNPLAAALMIDFGEIPERERNFMRLIFTEPRMRAVYPDWEGLARTVVSYIRMEAARKPDDPRVAEIVGELSIRDPQFRRWAAVPGSASEQALRILASWAADQHDASRGPA
jgi:MmyB-like transcription regulator ligand binding domain